MTKTQFSRLPSVRALRSRIAWALRHGSVPDIIEACEAYRSRAAALGFPAPLVHVAKALTALFYHGPVYRRNPRTGRLEILR